MILIILLSIYCMAALFCFVGAAYYLGKCVGIHDTSMRYQKHIILLDKIYDKRTN